MDCAVAKPIKPVKYLCLMPLLPNAAERATFIGCLVLWCLVVEEKQVKKQTS
jgi:hypothetical protein